MKIVFIDDERITIQLLNSIIDWESMGYAISGIALNGITGLQLCEGV